MKYALIILTHNAGEYVPQLAQDVAQLTQQPSQVIVVDSASADNTCELVRECFPTAILCAQPTNVDFCKGYNIGIREASEEAVLTVNQRVRLTPASVERLIQRMEQAERVAAVGPKIVQADNATIDSMGIVGDVRRHFSNLGEGEKDEGQYDNTKPFGISGACMLLRKEALEEIAHPGSGKPEYLDEDFVAYKDDIDLAYRLRHRGWDIVLEPRAVVSYARNTGDAKQRIQRSKRAKTYSLRNHWWLLLKNEPFSGILRNLLQISVYESLKLTYISITDPKTVLSVVPAYFKKLPRMLKKRQQILSTSRAKKTIDQWFQ